MLSNNTFLGNCWYGGHPWIRLDMESERMVEKGINFIFYLGTAYGISSMEVFGTLSCFRWWDGHTSQNVFISNFFALSSDTSTNPYFPLRRAFLFTLCNFYFLFESSSSLIKPQLRGTMIVLED